MANSVHPFSTDFEMLCLTYYFHVYRGRICFWSVLLVIHFILAMAQRQFQLWKWKLFSRIGPFVAPRTIQSWNSPGQNIGVGSLSFLQGIFPTQGLNPGLQHCGWILHQLSHKESPKILEWIAYPFRGFPDPGIEPGSPALQADSLPPDLLTVRTLWS